jgi:Zn-dependent protease with chaperone function
MLFVLGVFVTALYVAAPFFVVALILHTEDSSWPGIGALGFALLAAAIVASVAGIVAALGWRGIPRATLRHAGVREPSFEEARLAGAGLEPFSLARGIAPPAVWVVNGRAPNALACGRPGAAHVCFTTGAFRLPEAEFEALCAYELTALTCRPFVYCTSAIDVVLFAEWCTRVLWQLAALALLSAAVGVPAFLAATITASIAVLVAVTRLALVFADRALPRLLDDAAQLVDLEAVRLTAQPAAFARLLQHLLDDEHRVKTRWQIAHLWFERDEIEVGIQFVDPPALARRCERSNPRGLAARARRASSQANDSGQSRG